MISGLSAMLPTSSQEKQNAPDEVENRAAFKYQPDCTLDTEAEKLENEAHLNAHPGLRLTPS